MAKKTLNAKNLEALGAEKLAELCMELAEGSAEKKRRLRLELTHAAGAAELAHAVRKRLATIRRTKSYIGWRKKKAFIADLQTQAAMIIDKIAPDDPAAGFDLLWEFVQLAPSVYDRCDDSNGDLGNVFRAARDQIGDLASQAAPPQDQLADRVFAALCDNGYGEWDGVIGLLQAVWQEDGLNRLQDQIDAYEAGPDPEGQWQAERKATKIQSWRQEIADLTGDADGYLALLSPDQLSNPHFAAEAAKRLLSANRATEALDLLQAAPADRGAWQTVYLSALAALGRTEDLHAARLQIFHTSLDADILRDLVKALPDFEDMEAEDAAKTHALDFPDATAALWFFLDYPDLALAARLIETRATEIDGNAYDVLTTAAQQLHAEYPLAAVLCRRAMIRYTLDFARSKRVRYAIGHFQTCAELDPFIEDYAGFEDHDSFARALRDDHTRKYGFWSAIDGWR